MTRTLQRLAQLPDMPATPPGAGENGKAVVWQQSGGAFVYARLDARPQLSTNAQGLISETITRLAVPATTSIMVDGTVYYMALGLRAGDVISNIVIAVNTGGAGLTLSKAGLYSKTGTRLALSADLGTAWQSSGIKICALSATYTVPTDDAYYVAIVSKGGTLPTPIRTATLNSAGNPIGAGILPYATQTGQVDLPSPGTLTIGSTIGYWAGVS